VGSFFVDATFIIIVRMRLGDEPNRRRRLKNGSQGERVPRRSVRSSRESRNSLDSWATDLRDPREGKRRALAPQWALSGADRLWRVIRGRRWKAACTPDNQTVAGGVRDTLPSAPSATAFRRVSDFH